MRRREPLIKSLQVPPHSSTMSPFVCFNICSVRGVEGCSLVNGSQTFGGQSAPRADTGESQRWTGELEEEETAEDASYQGECCRIKQPVFQW